MNDDHNAAQASTDPWGGFRTTPEMARHQAMLARQASSLTAIGQYAYPVLSVVFLALTIVGAVALGGILWIMPLAPLAMLWLSVRNFKMAQAERGILAEVARQNEEQAGAR